ncbi:MAG: hypothetical protein NXI04_14395 [Planctomycetaceae bacterium]|nr:hypothetical protein [Planctomycetaceae bacterium]
MVRLHGLPELAMADAKNQFLVDVWQLTLSDAHSGIKGRCDFAMMEVPQNALGHRKGVGNPDIR